MLQRQELFLVPQASSKRDKSQWCDVVDLVEWGRLVQKEYHSDEIICAIDV